jgi:hypothetical protein
VGVGTCRTYRHREEGGCCGHIWHILLGLLLLVLVLLWWLCLLWQACQ